MGPVFVQAVALPILFPVFVVLLNFVLLILNYIKIPPKNSYEQANAKGKEKKIPSTRITDRIRQCPTHNRRS